MKHLFYTWKLGCLLLLILAGCSSKKSVSSAQLQISVAYFCSIGLYFLV